jgi:hypothetical protein
VEPVWGSGAGGPARWILDIALPRPPRCWSLLDSMAASDANGKRSHFLGQAVGWRIAIAVGRCAIPRDQALLDLRMALSMRESEAGTGSIPNPGQTRSQSNWAFSPLP